jgi:GNAT superfamily N-acetyltransferase
MSARISDHAPEAGSEPGVVAHARWQGSIRPLGPADLAAFQRHLQRLGEECRRARFGGTASDTFLCAYAGRVDFSNTAVLGCFVGTEMRGACELRSLEQTWCRGAELAFTVEKDWRAQGMASALMEQAIRATRRLPVEHLYLTCHLSNRTMQRIAKRFAARITYEDCECFADIALR